MNWDLFKNTLKSNFKNYQYIDEFKMSSDFAKLYDTTIRTGFDTYNNFPIETNIDILKSGFNIALLHAKNKKPINRVSKEIMSSIIAYWSTIKMSTISPPPGSIRIISNVIVFPGIPFEFPIYNTLKFDLLINTFINYFNFHLSSIRGIIVALVQTGSTTIPVEFPWIGIR